MEIKTLNKIWVSKAIGIGVTIGLIFILMLVVMLVTAVYFSSTYTTTSNQHIDGATYIINATYDVATRNCVSVNNATYIVANQTGIYYYAPLNRTATATVAKYLKCTG